MQIIKIQDYEYDRLRRIKTKLGGGFSIIDRLKKGGIGSPLAFYYSGLSEMEDLQLHKDVGIRTNFEELKKGFLLRFNDQRTTYLMAIKYEDIDQVSVSTVHSEVLSLSQVNPLSVNERLFIDLFLKHKKKAIRLSSSSINWKSWRSYFKRSNLSPYLQPAI